MKCKTYCNPSGLNEMRRIKTTKKYEERKVIKRKKKKRERRPKENDN